MSRTMYDDVAFQLEGIGVHLSEIDPNVFIGSRIVGREMTWVVCTRAATANAFELPCSLELSAVAQIAQAIIKWDISMMEGTPLSQDDAKVVAQAAVKMKDGPVKQIILGR